MKKNLKNAAAIGAAALVGKQAAKDLRMCPACHLPVAKNAYQCPYCGCDVDALDAEKAARPPLFVRANLGIVKYVGIGAIVLIVILALLVRAISS